MSRTFQQVVDRARIPLNDASKVRWTDADLLGYANDAILLLRKNRYDLFFGSYGSLPAGEYLLNNSIPVGDEYFPQIADYVTGRALFVDDEAKQREFATEFFALWGGGA